MMLSLIVSTALVLGQTDSGKNVALQQPTAAFGTPAAVLGAPTNQPDPKAPLAKPGEPADSNSYRIYDDGRPGFARLLLKAYVDEFKPKEENGNGDDPPRRALPSPFEAPPFPTAEYQGFPVIGLPVDTSEEIPPGRQNAIDRPKPEDGHRNVDSTIPSVYLARRRGM